MPNYKSNENRHLFLKANNSNLFVVQMLYWSKIKKPFKRLNGLLSLSSSGWARTNDPLINSQML